MLERSSLSCRKTNMTMSCSLLVVQARILLTKTDYPIEEAAQANFFSDVPKFYRAVVRNIVFSHSTKE